MKPDEPEGERSPAAGVSSPEDPGGAQAGVYRCPACGGSIYPERDDYAAAASLACHSCRNAYPVVDGVVRFISSDELMGRDALFRKLYDILGPVYDATTTIWTGLFHGGEARFRGQVLSSLEISRGYRVLETSIGTGANLPFIGSFTCDLDIYGLDISEGMLARCRKNLRRWGIEAKLCLANAANLPYEDESFDCVYHLGGINAFTEREKAINEMVRVARAGAVIMISDETEKMSYSKVLFRKVSLKPPVDMVPDGMEELIEYRAGDGTLYVLRFRKPA